MSKLVMVIGAIIFIFGLADFAGSYAEFDLWGEIGIQLPEVIWKYSAYIEMGLGAVLFGAGKGSAEDDE